MAAFPAVRLPLPVKITVINNSNIVFVLEPLPQNLAGHSSSEDDERLLAPVPGISPGAPRKRNATPVAAAGAPTAAPIRITESAWLPYAFQRDQHLYFIWPKAPGVSLAYVMSPDGMRLTVKINREVVLPGSAALAPYGTEIPMGIPMSNVEFDMALPHRCSPLNSQRLHFTSGQLEGVRVVRNDNSFVGHAL